MTDLILWNSIAKRRRSPSDDFLDNGLGMLKTFIEKQGFKVEVIDWARTDRWEKITPQLPARLLRFLTAALLKSKGHAARWEKIVSRLIGPLFVLSQELISAVQNRLQAKMIRELAAYVSDSGCPVVGIKTWYGDAYLASKYFVRCLRKLAPEVLIVAGGPHSSIYREAVLENGLFDIVVAGEGEKALSGLLALARRAGSRETLLRDIAREASQGHLKNIIYRSNGRVVISTSEKANANRKEVPSYDNFEGKTLIHVLIDSLGCPWGKCNFCVHSCIYREYSLRNPRSIVEEIEEMVSRGIGIFRFSGSTTALNHALEIARLIEQRGIRVIFSMFARAEAGAERPEVYGHIVNCYRELLRSGLRAVFLGAESAVDIIDELVMNKGITCENIVATVKAIRKASIKEGIPIDIGLSLICPSPTLGKITLERLKAENIKLVEQTAPDSVLVSPPAPFPGTAWFEESERFGFEIGDSFLREMLEYDYMLYKPPSLWPEVDLKLEGMGIRKILEECQSMRNSLEANGFITEVTDEHFLMMRAAGYAGKKGAVTFKNQALLSLISCDYRWTSQLQESVNRASRAQALANKS